MIFAVNIKLTTRTVEVGLRSQIGILKVDRGRHRKYRPYVFTEQGVAMLSSVLNSKRAIEMNVQIMRAFVEMRRLLASEKVIKDIALLKQVAALHGKDIGEIKQILKYLIETPEEPKQQIGFQADKKRRQIAIAHFVYSVQFSLD